MQLTHYRCNPIPLKEVIIVKDSFNKVPLELVETICSFLEQNELIRFQNISKIWYRAVSSESLNPVWEKSYLREFKIADPKPTNITWRTCFIQKKKEKVSKISLKDFVEKIDGCFPELTHFRITQNILNIEGRDHSYQTNGIKKYLGYVHPILMSACFTMAIFSLRKTSIDHYKSNPPWWIYTMGTAVGLGAVIYLSYFIIIIVKSCFGEYQYHPLSTRQIMHYSRLRLSQYRPCTRNCNIL